ncbi:MAG TPA: VWA domain-containing protein [Vicinamibacterales bacterium]|nr:VWA domain-containing protein [Vicinamibacterales bacterium]
MRHPTLAVLLCALVLLGAVALPLARPQGPALVFVSPLDGDYVSGRVTLKVEIQPPDTLVRNVNLFADGRLVCTVERVPYECAWDAGPRVAEHALRAVAVLADGQRLARAVRTKGVPYAETVDVDVVHITASVTDGRGEFVKGLARQAFRLFEDETRQNVTYFAAENVPLEIIVAVDVSGSMTGAMPQVKEATKKFLSSLRPSDRVTLIGFNDNVFTLARPSADLAARLRAVDRLAPWGGTALYDVVVQAIDQLGRQPGRRVLVVFSDGEDLNSHVPLQTAEERLEASDVVLYPIGQGRAVASKSLKEVLERLAHKTGGRAFFEDVQHLEAVYGQIIEELSNQYLLGYVPTNTRRDGAWRTVRVEVNDRSLRVRARQGYRLTGK